MLSNGANHLAAHLNGDGARLRLLFFRSNGLRDLLQGARLLQTSHSTKTLPSKTTGRTGRSYLARSRTFLLGVDNWPGSFVCEMDIGSDDRGTYSVASAMTASVADSRTVV
jgi:hypothetical protein